jgi:hypothetical protein
MIRKGGVKRSGLGLPRNQTSEQKKFLEACNGDTENFRLRYLNMIERQNRDKRKLVPRASDLKSDKKKSFVKDGE